MGREVELSQLDVRYESYRMKVGAVENRLLSLIAARGIEEPLEGVDVGGRSILLNGFKRYRCAQKLGIHLVPYVSLGEDEVSGILSLLRTSNNKSLSILEQASFIGELKNERKMSPGEIAAELSRSKSWVAMRSGLIAEMTPTTRRLLLTGAFPVYAYMYTLRQFMRMNGVSREEIERFMVALGGKGLSLREIEQLTHGYFRGPDSFRQEILSGNLALPLERMRQVPDNPDGCSEYERGLLRDLEITQKYMLRVTGKSQNRRLTSRTFHAQCHLVTAGILSRGPLFLQTIKELNARNGQA
jgi:hypothetical protein